MKLLSKLNRGAILFSIVLLIVIGYLIVTSINQSADTIKIKEICKNYVNIETAYKMLPEKYRVQKPSLPDAEKQQYIDTMKKEIGAFYPENNQSYKYLMDSMTKSIDSQASGNGVILEFRKTIKNFSQITFDGDSVTVVMDTSNKYNGPDINNPSKKSSLKSFGSEDTVILQNNNGTWKVVYSNLSNLDGSIV